MATPPEWQPVTRVPTPLTEQDFDGTTFWRSPDVLLSNAAGAYVIGWAELLGPWQKLGDQMVGREGAEIVWASDLENDFAPDLWLPLPARPDGTLRHGRAITLASIALYLNGLSKPET